MREIKFRQWIDGWHYWGFINGKFIPPAEMEDMEVARKHSYQFTGLHDKNGREIYEGDIVKWGEETEKGLSIGEVKWSKATQGWIPYVNNTSEVIGNIYEHGHLLTRVGSDKIEE